MAIYARAVLAVVFILLAASTGFGLLLEHRILGRLRERHQEIWKSVGERTLFRNNSFANGKKYRQFLREARYRALDDPRLSQLIAWQVRTEQVHRALLVTGLVALIVAFVGSD